MSYVTAPLICTLAHHHQYSKPIRVSAIFRFRARAALHEPCSASGATPNASQQLEVGSVGLAKIFFSCYFIQLHLRHNRLILGIPPGPPQSASGTHSQDSFNRHWKQVIGALLGRAFIMRGALCVHIKLRQLHWWD